LTFSLKDFKHIVALCDVVGQPLTLQVTRGGQPAVITTRWFNALEAAFVLATLIEQGQTTTTTPPATSAAAAKAMQSTPPTPTTLAPADATKKRPASQHSGGAAATTVTAGAAAKRMKNEEANEDDMNLASGNSADEGGGAIVAPPQGRLFLGDADLGAAAMANNDDEAAGEDEMDIDRPDDETVPATCPK
jgi:hypothetical protein